MIDLIKYFEEIPLDELTEELQKYGIEFVDNKFTEKLNEIPKNHSLEGLSCDWCSNKPNHLLTLSMRGSFWFCRHCKYFYKLIDFTIKEDKCWKIKQIK